MSGRRKEKVGIALAGGGPLGGIYEIGALMALEQALRGLDLTDLDLYVGVSSGAFVAAGLANGITPGEMHAMFILDRSHHDPFEPELLLRPAFGEFLQRLMMLPSLMQSALFAYAGASRSAASLILRPSHARASERPVRQRRDRLLSRGPVRQAGAQRRLPQAQAQALHRRGRSRHRQGDGVRRARLRSRADLRSGEGEFGAARSLSAGAHRRARLRRRRA